MTSGFKELSVSSDGLVVSFTFTQAGGEDVEISLPGAALSIVLPYFSEVDAESRRLREAPVEPGESDAAPP